MQRGGRPEDFHINASHALEVPLLRVSPALPRRPAMIRRRHKANGSFRRFFDTDRSSKFAFAAVIRAMAIFDGKQLHSSLETSALVGSTSREAALCKGAARLRITDHRAPKTRSRISAHTITSRVIAALRRIAGESAFTRVFDGNACCRARTGEAAEYATVHTTRGCRGCAQSVR
jgi:hypothetical protein